MVSVKYVLLRLRFIRLKLTHLQWILGNTFPFVVFTSFGAFWLGYGATLVPSYGAYGNYASPTTEGSTGLESVGFNAGIG